MRHKKWFLGLVLILALAWTGGDAVAKKPGGGGEDPPPPPADPAIAYVQEEGKSWNLKVMNADGTNQTLLVPDAGYFADPAWSPDGTKLIFASENLPGGPGLYVVPVDRSSSPSLLVRTESISPDSVAWSPVATPDDLRKIAWIDTVPYSYRYDVHVVNEDGTGYQNLTAAYLPTGKQLVHEGLAWSRDGSKLVTVRGYVPSESSDVQRALVEYALGVSEGDVLQVQGERNLLQGALSDARVYSPCYGRTDDTVLVSVFERVNNRDNRDIWEIHLSSPSSPTRLTKTQEPVSQNRTAQERHPDYGPDDTRMVYRIYGKPSNRDDGIFLKDTVLSSTPVQLIASAHVKDPAWRR